MLKKLDEKLGELIFSNGIKKMKTNSFFSLKIGTNDILKIYIGWKLTLTYKWMFLIFVLLICASVLHWKLTERTKLFLTHFSPVSHFYTSWKRQKTFGFLTFSGGLEKWHWTKMGFQKVISSSSEFTLTRSGSENFDTLDLSITYKNYRLKT